MCMGGCRYLFLVTYLYHSLPAHKQIWHQKHISITIAHHVSKFFTIEGDVFFYIWHVQWREKGHNLGLTRSLLESLAVLYVCSFWCCHLLHPGSLLFPAYNLLWTAWTLSALAKILVGLDTCVEFVGSMHVDFLWRLTNYSTTRHLGMVHLGPVPAVKFTLPIDHTTDQLQLPIFDALLWNRIVPLFLHAGIFGKQHIYSKKIVTFWRSRVRCVRHLHRKSTGSVFAFNLSCSVHFLCPGKFKLFS